MFYRQLLEPGLPDLEQVRRLCLDQGAPESAERAGRIGGQRNKGVRRLLYSWAAVCCLLLLTVSALLWRPVPQELAAGSQAGGEREESSSSSQPADSCWVRAQFYTLSGLPVEERCYFALLWEDFVPLSPEELADYFQLPFQPEGVAGFEFCQQEDSPYGIFRRSQGENAGRVYHDCNSLEYRSLEGAGRLWVAFTRENPALFHLTQPLPEEKEDSLLCSQQLGELPVQLYRYEGETEYCYAAFQIGETAYWVTSEGMNRERFLAALIALLG